MKIIKSTKFQITAMVIATCYIALFFIYKYKNPIFTEKAPVLLQVEDKIKKLATPVTIGLHINSFPDFSFANNNFSIDAILWFRFARGSESLETLNKFALQNSKLLGDGSLVYKSLPIIKIIDQDVLVSYDIQANFMASLNYNHFPADNHKLNIILQNKSVTAHELFFVTDPKYITFSEDILVHNWRPKATSSSAGYTQANLDPKNPTMKITYPSVTFSIDFEDVGARLPISLYLPLFILFFIMLISLTLGITDANRLALVAGGAPALVLFRLVIDSVSPHVGYATNIDKAYYLVVLLSLLILFLQAYIVLVLKKSESLTEDAKKKLYEKLENSNAILFTVILISLLLFLTIYII